MATKTVPVTADRARHGPVISSQWDCLDHRRVGSTVEFLVRDLRQAPGAAKWRKAESLPTNILINYFVARVASDPGEDAAMGQTHDTARLRSELEKVSRNWHQASSRCRMLESIVRVLQNELTMARSSPPFGSKTAASVRSDGSGGTSAVSPEVEALLRLGEEVRGPMGIDHVISSRRIVGSGRITDSKTRKARGRGSDKRVPASASDCEDTGYRSRIRKRRIRGEKSRLKRPKSKRRARAASISMPVRAPPMPVDQKNLEALAMKLSVHAEATPPTFSQVGNDSSEDTPTLVDASADAGPDADRPVTHSRANAAGDASKQCNQCPSCQKIFLKRMEVIDHLRTDLGCFFRFRQRLARQFEMIEEGNVGESAPVKEEVGA